MRRNNLILAFVLFVCVISWLPHTARVAARPSSEFGINTHIASRYGNYDVMSWPADVVASSGAGWAREDFHWFWIEPEPGRFQWEYYDRMVNLLTSRGVNVIGVLGHPPGWATAEPSDDPSGVSFYAPDPDRFAQFAAAVVERYRYRIVHWEIWNEPDNPQFWLPQPDPVAYATLLSRVYPVISEVAPEANVLIGGLNPFDTRFLRTIAEMGAWWAFDIINIHPYVDPTAPELNGGIGATARANIEEISGWAGAKPIWVTEFGWTTRPTERVTGISEEDQANYLVRGSVLLRGAGMERVLVYAIKDEAQNGYGLLRFANAYDDYSEPRTAFTAFTVLNQQLGGAAFERRLDSLTVVSGRDIYAYRFTRDGETIDVIWSLQPSVIKLPTSQTGATVYNRNGDRWDVAAEDGALLLYPDTSPIYVRQGS
ncbi:MAG: hypothetical protein HC828_14285 [Blastochloris sp.]|nr:hypothetical protein [Blastochloris sp.]